MAVWLSVQLSQNRASVASTLLSRCHFLPYTVYVCLSKYIYIYILYVCKYIYVYLNVCLHLSVFVSFRACVLGVFAIEILQIYMYMKHKQNAIEIRKSAANRTAKNTAFYILNFCGQFKVFDFL